MKIFNKRLMTIIFILSIIVIAIVIGGQKKIPEDGFIAAYEYLKTQKTFNVECIGSHPQQDISEDIGSFTIIFPNENYIDRLSAGDCFLIKDRIEMVLLKNKLVRIKSSVFENGHNFFELTNLLERLAEYDDKNNKESQINNDDTIIYSKNIASFTELYKKEKLNDREEEILKDVDENIPQKNAIIILDKDGVPLELRIEFATVVFSYKFSNIGLAKVPEWALKAQNYNDVMGNI